MYLRRLFLFSLISTICLGKPLASHAAEPPNPPSGGHIDAGVTPTLAIDTPLGHPWGVAIGRDGHLFFSDALKQQIYHLDDEGMLKLVAGNGVRGFTGVEGSAIQSIFSDPTSIAIGPDGLLYIADTRNHQVRRIEKDKRLTVIAGRGPGENGAGGFSGDGGPAADAQLDLPHGLDFDAEGSLYIADTGNHRIRKVSRPGVLGTITTVAGSGPAGSSGEGQPAVRARLNSPMDVSVGAGGRLLIADRYGARIREVQPDGRILTLAGGGTLPVSEGASALKVKLGTPTAVVYDRDGSILFADAQLRALIRVREGRLERVIGGRTSFASSDGRGAEMPPDSETPTLLTGPVGLTLHPRGGVVIADWSGHRILHLGEDGNLRVLAGSGEDASQTIASDAPRKTPPPYAIRAATRTPSGAWVWTDSERDALLRWENGRISTVVARNGNGSAADGSATEVTESFYGPSGILALPDGSLLYSESKGHRVRRITPQGKVEAYAGIGAPGFSGDGRKATETRLWSPAGLALDSAGNLYIADSMNHRIRKRSPEGVLTTVVGGNDAPLQKIAFLRRRVGAADSEPAASINPAPERAASAEGEGEAPILPARLKRPMAVAVDSTGALVIADTGNGLVRRVGENGVMETLAGGGVESPVAGLSARDGQMREPIALAFAPNGDLAVADAREHRVWIIGPNGVIQNVIGADAEAAGGAGTDTPAVILNRPTGLFYDPQGGLVIVTKDRLLRYAPAGTLVTLADRSTPGWGETDEAEPETATLSGKLKDAIQRFRDAGRSRSIEWREMPRISLLGSREAVVTWETRMPAWGKVEYGAQGRLDQEFSLTTLSTRPAVTLRDLEPNTEYLLRVRAYRTAGLLQEEIVSRFIRFTTRAKGEGVSPVIVNNGVGPGETGPKDDPGSLQQRIEHLREGLFNGDAPRL